MSKEDRDKIVNKAEKMGLPADQLLGHIAPEELREVNYLNKIAMIGAAVVIIAMGTGWFATITHLQDKSDNVVKLEGERDAAEAKLAKIKAQNLIVPKRVDELAMLRDLVNPDDVDMAGRTWIARACSSGDLAAVVYWVGRGTDINQPRYAGRFVHETTSEGVEKMTFNRSDNLDLRHRTPMMIAANSGHYHILHHFAHPSRRDTVDWNYSCFGETVLTTLKRNRKKNGYPALPLLDELITIVGKLEK
jgi:hypothetical protein